MANQGLSLVFRMTVQSSGHILLTMLGETIHALVPKGEEKRNKEYGKET